MKTLSVREAKDILEKLISETASEHEPILIKGRRAVVLIDEDDWRAIQETLYLLSVPGMRESIKEGLRTPAEGCSEELSEIVN